MNINAPQISDTASIAFLRFVEKAHHIQTEESFATWCSNDLRKFLPFGIMVCAVGRLFGDMIVVDELQGIDYPEEFMRQLSQRLALSERWALQRWLSLREPQLINESNCATLLSSLEQEEFKTFDLKQIAAHGMIAPNGLQASYFSFSRLKEDMNDITALKLRMVIPHLHQVRTQIAWNELQKSNGSHFASQLTPRELEVLHWILKGKTNPQIAALLERSAQTVKHQVASVLGKLNASNRAQAATRALELGIVAALNP
jgi:transcriptional regulator EpsA